MAQVPHYKQLISQATMLVTHKKKPNQADLRRSISSAYYALFHFLIDRSIKVILPKKSILNIRPMAARLFDHGSMMECCKTFASPSKFSPPATLKAYMPATMPVEIQTISSLFVDLQDKRRAADYDLAASFSRPDVLAQVQRTDASIAGWNRVSTTPEATLFLTCLFMWPQIKRRGG